MELWVQKMGVMKQLLRVEQAVELLPRVQGVMKLWVQRVKP